MKGFIAFQEILSFGISENYLKTACYRYRQNASKSWFNFKANGQIFIDLDTIPTQTRRKYGIPDGEGWEILKKARLVTEQSEQREKDKNLNYIKLKEAVLSHPIYFDQFRELLSEKGAPQKTINAKARKFSIRHAFFSEAVKIAPEKNTPRTNDLHQAGMEITKEFPDLAIKSNFTHFSTLLNRARTEGVFAVVHKCFTTDNYTFKNPKNNQQFGDFEKGLAAYYYSRPERYTHHHVHRLVNYVLSREDRPTVSLSWLKSLKRDPEFKNTVEFQSKGKKHNEDFIQKYVHRYAHPYANAVWQIDGTPSQTFCWDNGKWIRPYTFAVMDVFSKRIVGLSVSKSEDRNAIMTALQTAVDVTGQLPNELVMDNASAFKTDELKEVLLQLEKKGVVCRFAKVGNAKDKSQIERFWNTFQGKYEPILLNYIGRGITTDKTKRPSQHTIQQNLKRSQYTLNDMKGHLSRLIGIYNAEKTSKNSPNTLYSLGDNNPTKIEVDLITKAMLFFNTTKVKISRGEVKITYKKENYFYDFPVDHLLKYNGIQIKVKYDPSDMSVIWAFDDQDNLICECKEIVPANILAAKRTKAENLEILKVQAKNKAIERKAIDKYEDIIKPVKEIEKAHLIDTYKDSLNDSETLEVIKILDLRNDYRPEIARPINTTNSLTEYEKNDYEKMTDLISKKKK